MSNYEDDMQTKEVSTIGSAMPMTKHAFTQSSVNQRKRILSNEFHSSKYSQRHLISPEDIKKHAGVLFDNYKKSPVTHANTDVAYHSKFQQISSIVQTPTNATLDKTIDCKLDVFEKRLLKLYGINSIFDGLGNLIKKATEIYLFKNKLDESITNMDSESRKMMRDKAMLPNRYEIILLSSWAQEKIKLIEQSESNLSNNYKKKAFIYYLTLLEISRQESIICIERGKLLSSVWLNYFKLQEERASQLEKQIEELKAYYELTIDNLKVFHDKEVKMYIEEANAYRLYQEDYKSKNEKLGNQIQVLAKNIKEKDSDQMSNKEKIRLLEKKVDTLDKENKSFRTYCSGLFAGEKVYDKVQLGSPTMLGDKLQYDLGLIDQNKLRQLMIKSKQSIRVQQHKSKGKPVISRKYMPYQQKGILPIL